MDPDGEPQADNKRRAAHPASDPPVVLRLIHALLAWPIRILGGIGIALLLYENAQRAPGVPLREQGLLVEFTLGMIFVGLAVMHYLLGFVLAEDASIRSAASRESARSAEHVIDEAVPGKQAATPRSGVDRVPPETGFGPFNTDTLFNAIRQRDERMVAAILQGGVDTNRPTAAGMTPIQYAAQRGDAQMVQMLLTAGADVNLPDHDGWRPIHFAAYNGSVETAKSLLDKGADPDARINRSPWRLFLVPGATAEDLARMKRNTEVIALIRRYKGQEASSHV